MVKRRGEAKRREGEPVKELVFLQVSEHKDGEAGEGGVEGEMVD